MKINEIILPCKNTNELGINSIEMKKIGDIVLLAGRNGSGKTRILELVRKHASDAPNVRNRKEQAKEQIENLNNQINNIPTQRVQMEQNILNYERNVDSLKKQIAELPANKKNWETQIKNLKERVSKITSQFNNNEINKDSFDKNVERFNNNIKNIEAQIIQIPQQRKQFEENLKANEQNIKNTKSQILELPKKKADLQKSIEIEEGILKEPFPVIFDKEYKKITIIDFVPNKTELEDWSNINKKAWTDRADNAKKLGVSQLHQATIPLIQKVMDRWVNTTHQSLKFPDEEKNEAIADYKRLQEIIYSFLGERIGWNSNGYSTIFGRPIFETQLSAGQKILLQLSIAIFAQGAEITDYILLLDEPENHLHPSVVIEFLDEIKKYNNDGQIWIATHSIPLLSHFDSSSLWFVENGTISYSGKTPELVLNSLLGDQQSILRLKDFASLPDEMARNRFAFECLCPPKVVTTDSMDPQSQQLYEQLKIMWENKLNLNLLDFGAGKGRMIANLSDYEFPSNNTLNYYAFDDSVLDKTQCLANISLTFTDAEKRYYNSIESLRSSLGDNFFDVIVLTNVLHEIPYNSWIDIFKTFYKLIKNDGFLLLIEDCLLPNGEKPNNNGYIVFNTLHLIKLFKIAPDDIKFIKHDARFDSTNQRGRLMAHLIPSYYLENVSIETIKLALDELKESSKSKIKEIRKEKPSFSNGLAHEFWVQQLANSILCLSEIGD